MPMVLMNGPGRREVGAEVRHHVEAHAEDPAAVVERELAAERTSRACSSARNTSERVPVHFTGRPSFFAANSAAQYSG
jgi:hypothetical protein